jgi:hypothetical protein
MVLGQHIYIECGNWQKPLLTHSKSCCGLARLLD